MRSSGFNKMASDLYKLQYGFNNPKVDQLAIEATDQARLMGQAVSRTAQNVADGVELGITGVWIGAGRQLSEMLDTYVPRDGELLQDWGLRLAKPDPNESWGKWGGQLLLGPGQFGDAYRSLWNTLDGTTEERFKRLIQRSEAEAQENPGIIFGRAGTQMGVELAKVVLLLRVARFLEAGAPVAPASGVGRTGPASAYFGPNDFVQQNARAATPLTGYYDVFVHGNATSVELRTATGAVRSADHRALARLIEGMPDYRGQPIRLISCDTGQLPNGFAQNLSNKLGVEVLAPNTLVWPAPANGLPIIAATPSGQIVVFQPGAGSLTVTAPTRIPGFPDPVPTYPPTGQFNPFQPGGGRP
jgi:hypothetical protein